MKEIGSDYNMIFNTKKNKFKYEINNFFFLARNIYKYIVHNLPNYKYYLPNYLCESIYNEFVNYKFNFYKIDDNFNIDLKNFLLNLNDINAVVIINFFGKIDKNINIIKYICNYLDIIIIEDFTHNLFTNQLYGNICLCSYRKILETPFGGILIDKNNILKKQNLNTNIINYFFNNFLKISGMVLKNILYIKPIWYKILLLSKNYYGNIYNDNDIINRFFFNYYYRYDILYKRIENYNYLFKNLKNICLYKEKDLYFCFPIVLKNKKERDKIKKILIDNKIYCPIHWDVSFLKNSNNIYENILSIPIDQRYEIEDMKTIIDIIVKIIK